MSDRSPCRPGELSRRESREGGRIQRCAGRSCQQEGYRP